MVGARDLLGEGTRLAGCARVRPLCCLGTPHVFSLSQPCLSRMPQFMPQLLSLSRLLSLLPCLQF